MKTFARFFDMKRDLLHFEEEGDEWDEEDDGEGDDEEPEEGY